MKLTTADAYIKILYSKKVCGIKAHFHHKRILLTVYELACSLIVSSDTECIKLFYCCLGSEVLANACFNPEYRLWDNILPCSTWQTPSFVGSPLEVKPERMLILSEGQGSEFFLIVSSFLIWRKQWNPLTKPEHETKVSQYPLEYFGNSAW